MTRIIVGAARIAARVTASFAVAFTIGTLAGCGAAHHVPPAAQPQRPVWDGTGSWPSDGIEPLCPAADAGHVATVGTGADAFRVVCAWDGSEYAWGVVAGGAK